MVAMTSAKCQPTEALKFQLAMEISRIPNQRAIPCATHRIKPRSRFVDWYLVLRVEEDADTDSIRKQYHKLALLLHPDKNHHHKAEIAFKLVSEAYECLTDKSKRRAFNLDRLRRRKDDVVCYDCNKLPHSTLKPRTLKELGRRMEEEAKVIENCLRINRKSRNGYPVFSPSNYVNQGYPHQQSRDYRGRASGRRVKCETPVFELSINPLNVKSACLSS